MEKLWPKGKSMNKGIIAMDSTANTHRYVWEDLRENVTLLVSVLWLSTKSYFPLQQERFSQQQFKASRRLCFITSSRTLFVLRDASRSVDGETGSISFNGTWFRHLSSRSARQKKKHHELSRSYTHADCEWVIYLSAKYHKLFEYLPQQKCRPVPRSGSWGEFWEGSSGSSCCPALPASPRCNQ